VCCCFAYGRSVFPFSANQLDRHGGGAAFLPYLCSSVIYIYYGFFCRLRREPPRARLRRVDGRLVGLRLPVSVCNSTRLAALHVAAARAQAAFLRLGCFRGALGCVDALASAPTTAVSCCPLLVRCGATAPCLRFQVHSDASVHCSGCSQLWPTHSPVLFARSRTPSPDARASFSEVAFCSPACLNWRKSAEATLPFCFVASTWPAESYFVAAAVAPYRFRSLSSAGSLSFSGGVFAVAKCLRKS
jgi:hypothetical protein